MKVKSQSEVAQSCLTLSDPMDCSHQAPPSMGFSRQECWSGSLLPLQGNSHCLLRGLHYVYLKHNGVGEGERNYVYVAMLEISLDRADGLWGGYICFHY